MTALRRRSFLAAFAALSLASPAVAADVQVAVAANFTKPAKEIAVAFHRATGNNALLIFGSSGAFYMQITQGAPFEVLLSADAERPMKAETDGLGVPGSRFTYAIGRLVLYSTQPALVDDGGKVLARGNFNKLAIADPAAAPYGAAAVQTMTSKGVYSKLAAKIVKGGSIAQAYLFVS
jgi:molybdate transport system substrate-binding protein